MLNFSKNRVLASLLLVFLAGPTDADQLMPCGSPQQCRLLLDATASKLVGSKYGYGASGGNGRFDCSGLVRSIVGALIGECPLPRTSQAMYASLAVAVPLSEAKVGDLLFFNTGAGVSHVGLFWGRDDLGNPRMYHASSSKGVRMESILPGGYWSQRLVGVKRLPQLESALFGGLYSNHNPLPVVQVDHAGNPLDLMATVQGDSPQPSQELKDLGACPWPVSFK